MLMASGDESVTLNGVPDDVPAPVQIFVPGCRTTVDRPGSIVNVMLEGARPLVCDVTSAPVAAVATVYVNLPLPRLLMLRLPAAIPRLQSSIARKTSVVAGIRIG